MTRSFWSCSTTPIDGFAASGRFHGAHQVFHHALSLSENSECRLNPLIHWFKASASTSPRGLKGRRWRSEEAKKTAPPVVVTGFKKRIRKPLIAIETNMGKSGWNMLKPTKKSTVFIRNEDLTMRNLWKTAWKSTQTWDMIRFPWLQSTYEERWNTK